MQKKFIVFGGTSAISAHLCTIRGRKEDGIMPLLYKLRAYEWEAL